MRIHQWPNGYLKPTRGIAISKSASLSPFQRTSGNGFYAERFIDVSVLFLSGELLLLQLMGNIHKLISEHARDMHVEYLLVDWLTDGLTMYIDFLLYSNRTYLCITDGLVLCLEILHRCHQYYPWGYYVMCHPFSERFCILRIHPSIFKVTRIKLNILGILIQTAVVCILRWVWKCWEIVFERRFGKFT